ncbi:MAG: mechanosensitive ion channel family protein [Bacteroidia bacterium]|nr:mechanosensitive ion channel family protein [Bacteroidia bacterium]
MKFLLQNHPSTIVFLLFAALLPQALLAQDSIPSTSPREQFSQKTPRGAVERHLYYLHADSYQPELAAEVIYGDFTLEEKIELATQLRDVFDARGYYIETELIPDEEDYKDSLSGQSRYVILPNKYPDVFLTRKDGLWYYSQTTIALIPELYQTVIPFGADLLQGLVPKVGKQQVLGMAIWKWLGLALIIGFSYLLFKVLNIVLGILFKRVLPRFTPASYFDPALVPPVARPFSAMLVIFVFRSYLMPMLLLPISITDPLRKLLIVLISVFGVMVVYKLVDVFASVFQNLASKTETAMDDQLVPLLARAAKLVVVIFGLLFVMDNLQIDVTALLAGVSIGGLAIALAAQDTVKNFIGSISIFVDRPFTVGDFINAGDITGTVVEVGVRTTRIRALDGAAVTVPNGDLSARVITNHTVRTYRRYATSITVTYSTKPDKMEEFVTGVREIVQAHPKVRPDSAQVQFHEMSNSSLDIFYAAIFEVTDHGEWLACRQDVFLAIMRLAARMEIDFAFPSTSVYIEQMPTGEPS